jgi:hypothetical protein
MGWARTTHGQDSPGKGGGSQFGGMYLIRWRGLAELASTAMVAVT